MNREIKFRAWDNNMDLPVDDISERMYNWDNLNDLDKNGLIHLMDVLMGKEPNIIPMQYTGLKDKNGVEIYDGDVVTFKTSEQGQEVNGYARKEIVRFCRSSFSIGHGHLYEWQSELGLSDGNLTKRYYVSHEADTLYMIDFDIEVIGNIHQNPELLP